MIKSKSYEKLTDDNIQRVIKLLEGDNPVTKKEACEILNIRYNTTRLQKIIDDWKDTQEFKAKRKAMNKGKPASRDEIKTVAQMYVEGYNVSSIAASIYRSPAFVKNIIERIGIPMKLADTDYEAKRRAMLPEQCVADTFQKGEVVWAIRANYPAKVVKELLDKEGKSYEDSLGYKIYLVYTIECTDLSDTFFPHLPFAGRYHTYPAYELGSLKHLEQYGVKFI